MKTFLTTLAGVFAGFLLFFIGLPFLLIVAIAASARPAATPARTVLSLDLRRPLTDQDPQNPFAGFGGSRLSVMGVTATLRRAATDGAVRGLLIRLPEGGLAPAEADELREALLTFRGSGKPVIAHSQGVYPSGFPASTYMLGAASGGGFWMQPQASLQVTGVAREDQFFKRFFDRYGVVADYQQRYEYKNAVNPFLYDDYTAAHREAELGWVSGVYATELVSAGLDRRTDPQALRTALEAGPYMAADARARGLVDHLGQVSEAEAQLKRQAGPGAVLQDVAVYQNAHGDAASTGRPVVAVIEAEGDIQTGTARDQGFNSPGGIFSDDLSRTFAQAAADPSVKAIVFRVSSPGGGDTASEQIGAAVRAARAAGKPVVVSMGTYAASGGYWISADADEIVAQPSTLTGSIGVFGGKFAIGPALAKFGIDTRGLSVGGAYADAFNSRQGFTPEQKAAFAGWMDRIYAGFVERVATGRKLPVERVREIAKGRVWTGAQAVKLGLVDKLGGFQTALAEARRLGGIGGGQVTLKRFDKVSPFESLGRLFGRSQTAVRTMAALAWVMGDPRAQGMVDAAVRLRMEGDHQAAALAPLPGLN